MNFEQPPVVRVDALPDHDLELSAWPATIPAVAQVLRGGLELSPGVTLLVGENGSGKSTLVEGIAIAYGLGAEGGSSQGGHNTRTTESPLHTALRVQRGLGTKRWGFFLRAETMHGWFTYQESLPKSEWSAEEPVYHERSHGESFLDVLLMKFGGPGFYCLDEPEAALSFSSQLALVGALHEVVAAGGQVLCATHSPLIAAMTGVTLLEVGDWGLRETNWEDLEMVSHWRRFLDQPRAYLRHVES